jgi:hypothetical protein
MLQVDLTHKAGTGRLHPKSAATLRALVKHGVSAEIVWEPPPNYSPIMTCPTHGRWRLVPGINADTASTRIRYSAMVELVERHGEWHIVGPLPYLPQNSIPWRPTPNDRAHFMAQDGKVGSSCPECHNRLVDPILAPVPAGWEVAA